MKSQFALISLVFLAISCGVAQTSELQSHQSATLPVYRGGGASEFPTELKYQVASNHDANHCEFYVNSFGKGVWEHNSAYQGWVEAYLSVDEASLQAGRGAKVLNAGMFVSYRGERGATDGVGLYLGRRIEDSYYSVRMTHSENVHAMSIVEVRRAIERIAFFVDVQRASGAIERLWLKNGSQDFTMGSIFDGQPVSWKSLGAGAIAYVEGQSPVFNQKRACQN